MLVGRDHELARLNGILAAARAGSGGTLVIVGEPGIGKTSLLAYAAAQAAGFRVLRAVGVESESELPFAGLQVLLQPIRHMIGDLPDSAARAMHSALGLAPARTTGRFAVELALLGLLSSAAEDAPLVCLLDDAHWLDPASIAPPGFVARRIEAEAIVMLFATREREGRPLSEAGLSTLVLEGLGDRDARALLAASTSGPIARSTVDRLIGAAGGNPLALVELPRLLSPEELAGWSTTSEPVHIGRRLVSAFASKLPELPSATRTALLVAAANDDADLTVIAQALAELGVPLESFGPAEDAGLVIVGEGVVRFRHPLVRSAAYQSCGVEVRRKAHLALAKALASIDPARRAWHLAAAAAGPNEDAAGALEAASDIAAQRGGLAVRATMIEAAARLTPDPANRARRLYLAGRAHWNAGSIVRARSLLDEAVALARDPVLRADIQFRRAQISRERGGKPDEVLHLLVSEARRVAPSDAERAAQMLGWATIIPLFQVRPKEALRLAREAEQVAGDGAAENLAVLDALAWAEVVLGMPDGRERAVRGARKASAEGDIGRGADLAQILTVIEEYDLAGRLLDSSVANGRATGELLGLGTDLWARAALLLRQGELVPAYAAAREALDIAEQTESPFAAATMMPRLAAIEAVLGRAEDCRAHAASAMQQLDVDAYREAHIESEVALGRLALGLGDALEAVRHLEPAAVLLRDRGLREPAYFQEAADLIEALVRVGRPEDATAELDELTREGEALQRRWAMASAFRYRGLLATDSSSDTCFEEALRLEGSPPNEYEAARTLLCWGERLRRDGRRVDARRRLQEAVDSFERIGARSWAERARRELRASGVHARRRRPSALDELTTHELQIALIVAEGLSNREAAARLFVSPKTIEKHLSIVYAKLGVRSRVELAHRLRAPAPDDATRRA